MQSQLAGRKEWIALAVLCLPMLIVSMDVSVLFYAVPFIAADLQPTASQMLWTLDIYAFVLAGLLISMGSVGDRIGRRRLLLIGATAFGGASAIAAYAHTAEVLIGARALLGVAGATLMPSTLALIRNIFHDEAQRGKAIATWSAVLTGGVTLGPVVSGFLLEHFWWGSVFLINLPFMVMLLVVGPMLLPEYRSENRPSFDLLSAVLALAAILPVIYCIKSIATEGTSRELLAYGAAGVVAGIAFVVRQLRTADPLVDLRMLANRAVGGGITVNVIAMFVMMGSALVMTQYLQSVLGLSPLRAALWSLAPAFAVGAAAPVSVALAGKLGNAAVMSGGMVVSAGGFVMLSRAAADSALWHPLTAAGLISGGIVAVLSIVSTVIMSAAPAERAGSVAGLLETSSELGGALGLALLGSLLAKVYRSEMTDTLPQGVPADAAHAAQETLAGAQVVAQSLPTGLAAIVRNAAEAAYMIGMQWTCLAAAAVLAVTAIVNLVVLPKSRPAVAPAEAVEAPEPIAA